RMASIGSAASAAAWRCTASRSEAMLLGGHVRLGFENNMALPDGSPAPDNAALVAHFRRHTDALHRPLASAADLRAWFAR
ncbi:3-keto-5-aminohexanoate cleavage protein, partial [Ralstonia pseudosolanacearum]|uniref:3-keto-5-aminohexanoate cleavage protein n=1 Tax=Ralstonia pseudosolanacearum TaxID=1310165 RepID=UPI003CECF78F